MAGSAIRGTSRSSTSIATIAATASQRARKRFRCARWRPICSAISGRAGRRWGRFEALPKNASGGVLPLPHELRAQHQALDPVVAAVDFLRVAGQADRLDDGAEDRKSVV